MKNSRFSCKKLVAVAVLVGLPFVAAVSAPGSGDIEAGLAAGISGAVVSLDLGFADAGRFDFSVGLAAGNPWSALAPSAGFTLGTSVSPWRSPVRIESSAIAGLAKIPGIGSVAPYGGVALGLDFPLGSSGFAIRAETAARFGGREYVVSAANDAGTIRFVDAWAPALVDVQVGIRWKPGK